MELYIHIFPLTINGIVRRATLIIFVTAHVYEDRCTASNVLFTHIFSMKCFTGTHSYGKSD